MGIELSLFGITLMFIALFVVAIAEVIKEATAYRRFFDKADKVQDYGLVGVGVGFFLCFAGYLVFLWSVALSQ